MRLSVPIRLRQNDILIYRQTCRTIFEAQFQGPWQVSRLYYHVSVVSCRIVSG
jgi:hypothetical protein